MAYQQISRLQLRNLLIERLGALGTSFYRTAELNAYVQESLRFFNLCTGFWKTRTTLTTRANQTWYQFSNPIITSPNVSGLRVSWQSQPLTPASMHDMGFGRPSWKTETTATGRDVPTSVKIFVVGALNLIAIWPQDAAGNSQLDIDGVSATPLLTSDSQLIDLGQEELKIILDYCEHVALLKQGGLEFQQGGELFKSFLKAVGERNAILKANATFRKYMGLDRQRFQKPLQSGNTEPGAR